MTTYLTGLFLTILVVAGFQWFATRNHTSRNVPPALRPGQAFPEIDLLDEQGAPVNSSSLLGTPFVVLFVRGTWCPFCTAQVEQLTQHYKDITDLGAKLIFVTPKPLETTRRVAEFFKVDFSFWLDPELRVARQLELEQTDSVPGDFQGEYGKNTVWPAAFVIDSGGIVRYAQRSADVTHRPDPKEFLRVLRSLK